MLDEKSYRIRVNEVFARISKAFDAVDPDVVEAELSQGSLTLTTGGGKVKTILSPQPSVRQIWLAAAQQGLAVHFSFNEGQGKWMDDKDRGFELFAFTQDVVKKAAGVDIVL